MWIEYSMGATTDINLSSCVGLQWMTKISFKRFNIANSNKTLFEL